MTPKASGQDGPSEAVTRRWNTTPRSGARLSATSSMPLPGDDHDPGSLSYAVAPGDAGSQKPRTRPAPGRWMGGHRHRRQPRGYPSHQRNRTVTVFKRATAQRAGRIVAQLSRPGESVSTE